MAAGTQSQGLQSPETLFIDSLSIEEKLNVIRTWSVIHLEVLRRFKKYKNKKGTKFFAGSDDYAKLFTSILRFFVPPS